MQRAAAAPLLGLLILGACSDSPSAPNLRANNGIAPTISVMTRNVYVGADVDAVIAALATSDPTDDFPALQSAIQTLGATDYETRMAAIADEIAQARPHVVGLQEITQLYIAGFVVNAPADIEIDFLEALLPALDARGLHYTVGEMQLNIDLTLFGGAIALRDYDVVLYDADRASWTTEQAKTFDVNIPPEEMGGLLIQRGWIWGRLTTDGATYDIVSTHPEAGGDGDPNDPRSNYFRAAQIGEIVQALDGAGPAILMGDLNDVPGSPMYDSLTTHGFGDAWAELRGGTEGFTCCHLSDLSNPTTDFTKRIDYIFARGIGQLPAGLQGQIDRVGEVPADRVQGPQYVMWPSDHAGLVAQFLAPPAPGLVTD